MFRIEGLEKRSYSRIQILRSGSGFLKDSVNWSKLWIIILLGSEEGGFENGFYFMT